MRVLVTGGAGFLGSLLVPALLEKGHDVTVVDTFWFGDTLADHARLRKLRMELGQVFVINESDAVIHLACLSNDPSCNRVDPDWARAVNYDATVKLVRLAQQGGAVRFIYASSSSVYGVKPDGVEVTEDLSLEPLTDYSKYKALSEEAILAHTTPIFTTTVLRPATLCGYSPRQRLDLIVNAMTRDAVLKKEIRLEGGNQRRPNLHVQDMVRAYLAVLDAPIEKVSGQIFNVGGENATAKDLAERVKAVCGGKITSIPTVDERSYSINSDKFNKALKFKTKHIIEDAITELKAALTDGRLPEALTATKYRNLDHLQAMGLACA